MGRIQRPIPGVTSTPTETRAGGRPLTEKQIEANRRNAQKSTGPATAEGRTISSKNSLKHGLTARQVTASKEEAREFAAFRNDIVADLAPVGALEEELVQAIAIYSWRLRRVYRLEVNGSDDSNPLSSLAQEHVGGGMFGHYMLSLGTLSRYETSIARLRERALHDLERLQARRQGEAVELPIAVDVTHSMEAGSDVERAVREARESDGRLDRDQKPTAERSRSAPVKRVRLVTEH